MSAGQLQRKMRATAGSVDEYCQELRQKVLAGVSRTEGFIVEVLVREALLNAVIHGSDSDPRNQVTCSVELLANGVSIQVADGGPGFNWRAWRAPSAPPLSSSGHGLNILYSHGSEVRFNESGNVVEIIRRFGGDRDGN